MSWHIGRDPKVWTKYLPKKEPHWSKVFPASISTEHDWVKEGRLTVSDKFKIASLVLATAAGLYLGGITRPLARISHRAMV
jgi:hypothetical protein